MIAKDPTQSILEAAVQVLNPVYEGEPVPVTTTYHDSDRYVFISVPDSQEEGTDDTFIFDVVFRVEVVTEFVTDYERETPSNEIMGQITQTISDVDLLNAALSDFQVILVNSFSAARETQQENTSSLITKRKDFNLKVEQL